MNRIRIRPGTPADRPFVEDLGKRTMVDNVAAFREPIENMLDVSFERLLMFVYDQAHDLAIAESDGRAVGFCLSISSLPDEVTMDPQSFIAYMAVEPAYRRSGAATELLKVAEGEARKKQMPYIALMVTEGNVAARNLYESAGYFTERRLLCKIL